MCFYYKNSKKKKILDLKIHPLTFSFYLELQSKLAIIDIYYLSSFYLELQSKLTIIDIYYLSSSDMYLCKKNHKYVSK